VASTRLRVLVHRLVVAPCCHLLPRTVYRSNIGFSPLNCRYPRTADDRLTDAMICSPASATALPELASAFATVRLLPIADTDTKIEKLTLRHKLTSQQRQAAPHLRNSAVLAEDLIRAAQAAC
jgi:hypothetical protein